MMRLNKSCFLMALLMISFSACQGHEESEFYGSLLDSPSGLVLEQSEHTLAWGRSDCLSCHSLGNIHQIRDDRTSPFDMEEIQEFVLAKGESSCANCHGSNGVETEEASE